MSKQSQTAVPAPAGDSGKKRKKKKLGTSYNWQFWAIIALPMIYAFILAYVPMGGIIMAFENYSPRKGIFHSQWVGLRYFRQFFTTPSSSRIIINTLRLGIYSLLVNFPLPIILAICLNEMRSQKYKKFIQMVTYAPYFISTVVLVGMMMKSMDLRTGIFNTVLKALGFQPVNFFGDASLFPSLYVWSTLWQTAGYSSIIYIAALAGVNPELQEAAIVDGASRIQRILHVDLPSIAPTIITMLIFNSASVINIGFDKVYLMQNDINRSTSEVISTFVYKVGLTQGDFGFSTAAGLFQSAISFGLLVLVNFICKRLTDTSLW